MTVPEYGSVPETGLQDALFDDGQRPVNSLFSWLCKSESCNCWRWGKRKEGKKQRKGNEKENRKDSLLEANCCY